MTELESPIAARIAVAGWIELDDGTVEVTSAGGRLVDGLPG
ncbi:hypothetical protein [Tsukamurella sp. 1534]|nr:hypothetical protein [Tsukamurella sp. 1534]